MQSSVVRILILLSMLIVAWAGVGVSMVLPILILLLVYLFAFSPKMKRVEAERAENKARPTYRSPIDEYREAITAELSPGERLLAACECYTFSLMGKKARSLQMHWFILDLTNITLRKTIWRKGSSGSIPELGGMETFPISDVASHQYLTAKPAKEIHKRLVR